MIFNNFGAIILKRKELKPLFQIFIKQFQQQLAFIQDTIQSDAQEMKKQANCCYCIFRRLKCFGKNEANRFQMYNRVFYNVFTAMNPVERQEYFIELLGIIEELGRAYTEYTANKSIIEELDVNRYKTLITKRVVEKLVAKEVIQYLQTEEGVHPYIDLLVEVQDKDARKKVGRLKNLKFQLIEKIHGVEQKIVMNLRNYQNVKSNQEKTIKLLAIYETITPVQIALHFVNQRSASQFQKYKKIIFEVVKIGKIQKLISNIDLAKVFGKGYNDQKNRDHLSQSSLMKTFVKQEEEEEENMQKNYIDSEEIIKSSTSKNDQKLRRIQTIKQDHYEEVKKRLIQTLKFLAGKKEQANLRVIQFRKRPAIKVPKQKSEAIERVLKSTQAFVARKIINPQKNQSPQEIQRDILSYAIDIESQKYKLNIINQHCQKVRNNGVHSNSNKQNNNNSFVDSDASKSVTSQKFSRIFNHDSHMKRQKVQFNRNIYKKLYPQDYKFTYVQSLMDMIKLTFDQFYIFSEEAIIKQSNNLRDDKLAKFKANWLERLTKTIKVYYRKQSSNFIKIFIPFGIQIKSLVQAVINIEAYTHWHPNIRKAEIVTVINSENAVIYKMDILNPISNKLYSQTMLMHLFRLEGRYYIVQKKIDSSDTPNNAKGKGILNFFKLAKSVDNYSSMDFSMIRISNVSKNGYCEMVVSYDYEPIEPKFAHNARSQLMTFFLNYVFITNYWKLSQEQKMFNPDLFSYDWVISKTSFDHDENSVKKDSESIDMFDDQNYQNSKISVPKYAKGQSSESLVRSSQFYQI